MKTKKTFSFFYFFIFVIFQPFLLFGDGKAVDFDSSNLPIIIINTYGQNIPYDDPRIVADMGIIYNGIGQRNSVSDQFNNYDGKISIEIRGSSSAGWSKKSYGIETQNDDMEKIKRDKNRVNIAKLKPDEISGDDLTGGYIIKIDKEPWKPGFDSKYLPFSWARQKIRYQYHYPKADDIVPQQEEYISNFIYEFEDVMNSDNYADSQNGYSQYINVESFVDNFLLNELSKNVDAYRLSTFFHKDKNGKLVAGPAWDFNFSFGNIGYYDAELVNDWQLEFLTEDFGFRNNDNYQVPFWWRRLFDDLNFKKKLHRRWLELRKNILDMENLKQFIDSVADTLEEAQERNFQVWIGPGDPKLPEDGWFPPTFPIDHLETYADEIEYLKTWMSNRMEWMDQTISAFADVSLKDGVNYPADFDLKQNYPNPFNSFTFIEFQLPKREFVELKIVNTHGEVVQNLLKEFCNQGFHQIKFDSIDLVSGIYFYRLKISSGEKLVKKMIIIK